MSQNFCHSRAERRTDIHILSKTHVAMIFILHYVVAPELSIFFLWEVMDTYRKFAGKPYITLTRKYTGKWV